MDELFKGFVPDKEAKEYAGSSGIVNGHPVIYREAKITPTKVGAFVTLWQRNHDGITVPMPSENNIAAVVIKDPAAENGYFVFDHDILTAKKHFSTAGKGGKRGFRVYSPDVETTNKQAKQTQKWQQKSYYNTEADALGAVEKATTDA